MKTPSVKPKQLAEVAQKYNDVVVGICLACDKPVKGGYYSQHEGGGTCNKSCMQVQDAKQKYPGYSEADFLERLTSKRTQ